MVRFLLRSLWRLVILLIGTGLVWGVVYAYPFADERLPWFVILLLLYILCAYVVIPALIRLLRIFIKPNLIPLYATTGDGWASDPVNIALIVKNRTHLISAMTAAGWCVADPITLRTSLRELVSIILGTPYPTAPFSNLYLFNRPHDIGFQISTCGNDSARTRHHVRLWRLEEPVPHHDNAHHTFWTAKLKHLFTPEKEMWIGTATEDIRAVAIRLHNGQITHGVSHESDKERDYVIDTLRHTGAIAKLHISQPGKELRFRGQQLRTFYVSNGSIPIARLR
jgi:hypothetical protein